MARPTREQQHRGRAGDRRGRRRLRRRGMRIPIRAGGGGIGLLVILAILWIGFGINPMSVIGMDDGSTTTTQTASRQGPGVSGTADETDNFVAVVLGDTEDVWNARFSQMGQTYREPTLVLFDRQWLGLRQRHVGDRPVLLPERPETLHRLGLLPAAPGPAEFAGRLRAGLCRGPRGRASRAEPSRHPAAHHRIAPAVVRGRRQRRLGAGRAAGGLLRRHLGARHAAGRLCRERRRRGGPERRQPDRRRHVQRAQPGNRRPDSFTHGTPRRSGSSGSGGA